MFLSWTDDRQNPAPSRRGFAHPVFAAPFVSSASAPYLSGMLSRTRRSHPASSRLASRHPLSARPAGPDWVHEIKHDGYRLMPRRGPVGGSNACA